MAHHTAGRQRKTPARRLQAGAGYFFPNEVIRILGISRVDYRQLKRLYRLVQAPGCKTTPGKWTRYTFRDLVALRSALECAGGKQALQPGKRLQLKPLEAAREALKDHFGVKDPLLEVALRREGRKIIASFEGTTFEPATGQVVMVFDQVKRYLDALPTLPTGRDRLALKARIEREERVLKEHAHISTCVVCGQRRARGKRQK